MKRWEFDSIEQALNCISSWYSGTSYEGAILQDYLADVGNIGMFSNIYFQLKRFFLKYLFILQGMYFMMRGKIFHLSPSIIQVMMKFKKMNFHIIVPLILLVLILMAQPDLLVLRQLLDLIRRERL